MATATQTPSSVATPIHTATSTSTVEPTATPTAIPAHTATVSPAPPLSSATDDFNAGAIGPLWETLEQNGATLVQADGRLQFSKPTGAPWDARADARTVGTGSFKSGQRVFADIGDDNHPVDLQYAYFFVIHKDSPLGGGEGNHNSAYWLFNSANGLVARINIDGWVTSYAYLSRDRVQQRYVGLRYDVDTDHIVWETSPDGVTWTSAGSVPWPFSVSDEFRLRFSIWSDGWEESPPFAFEVNALNLVGDPEGALAGDSYEGLGDDPEGALHGDLVGDPEGALAPAA